MTRVKIAELKDHLSEHLRAVERGGEIEVTDRDRPIARISPLKNEPGRTGVDISRARRSLGASDRKAEKRAGWTVASLDLLLEERRER